MQPLFSEQGFITRKSRKTLSITSILMLCFGNRLLMGLIEKAESILSIFQVTGQEGAQTAVFDYMEVFYNRQRPRVAFEKAA